MSHSLLHDVSRAFPANSRVDLNLVQSATLAEVDKFLEYAQESAQHVYHHNEPTKPTVNVSAERNSRGINWSATVIGASSVSEAMNLLKEAQDALEHRFGSVGEVR